MSSAPKKVAIVGSGNWGTAIAKIVGKNCARLPGLDNEVCQHKHDSVPSYSTPAARRSRVS